MRVGIVCALAVLVAACGSDAETAAPPSELEGLITRVDGQGSRVVAFVIETSGESHEIRIASDVDYGFDLAHLREHEVTAEPVRVQVERRSGTLYALRIDDA